MIILMLQRYTPILRATTLRQNKFYYRFYYIFLNAAVGTFIPLCVLIYLNSFTVITLKKIIRQDDVVASGGLPIQILRKSVSTDNLDKIIEKPLFRDDSIREEKNRNANNMDFDFEVSPTVIKRARRRSNSFCIGDGLEAFARKQSLMPLLINAEQPLGMPQSAAYGTKCVPKKERNYVKKLSSALNVIHCFYAKRYEHGWMCKPVSVF